MAHADGILADAAGLEGCLDAMAKSLLERRCQGAPLRLVGMRSRGVPLAQRLALRLSKALGEVIPVGALDITLYRDDLSHSQRWPVLQGTNIPFSVDDAEIVLVDDVLFTGRTVRAALNAICDLGRPAVVRLAVLVDRGHRELPVQADVVGLTVTGSRNDRVQVQLQPADPVDEIRLVQGK